MTIEDYAKAAKPEIKADGRKVEVLTETSQSFRLSASLDHDQIVSILIGWAKENIHSLIRREDVNFYSNGTIEDLEFDINLNRTLPRD